MKLASLRQGRDGALVVVSRDLSRCVSAPAIAPTLQNALDNWPELAPRLTQLSAALNAGRVDGEKPFDTAQVAAPLPRAYQWADGSAYVTHVELVRKSRNAPMPESFWSDPLIYQGGSDSLLAANDPIVVSEEAWGVDFEGELAIITDDVPMATSAADAQSHIKLLMLVNDVSLRNLIPAELAKGFGFFQSKPSSAFSPVAVTPDELGDAWSGGKVHLPLHVTFNGKPFGRPDAGKDMVFSFLHLIAHAARTRPLGTGTILGSGTISNTIADVGSACIAERRAREMLEFGTPKTPFMKFADHIRMEMFDSAGRSIFGAIDQQLVHHV